MQWNVDHGGTENDICNRKQWTPTQHLFVCPALLFYPEAKQRWCQTHHSRFWCKSMSLNHWAQHTRIALWNPAWIPRKGFRCNNEVNRQSWTYDTENFYISNTHLIMTHSVWKQVVTLTTQWSKLQPPHFNSCQSEIPGVQGLQWLLAFLMLSARFLCPVSSSSPTKVNPILALVPALPFMLV